MLLIRLILAPLLIVAPVALLADETAGPSADAAEPGNPVVMLWTDGTDDRMAFLVEIHRLVPAPKPALVTDAVSDVRDPSRLVLAWAGDEALAPGELDSLPEPLQTAARMASETLAAAGPVAGANPMVVGRDCIAHFSPPRGGLPGVAVSVGIDHVSQACPGLIGGMFMLRNW